MKLGVLAGAALAAAAGAHAFAPAPAPRRAAGAPALAMGMGPERAAGGAVSGARRAAAESDAAGQRVVPADDMEFHMQWSYARPQDILPYIYATARRGQVDEIIRAMDEFGR